MANLIDMESGDKVDCFMLGPDPIDRLAFSRRRLQNIMGVNVPLASAEDWMSISMVPEKFENQIAMQSQAGREGLAIWQSIIKKMPGEQKVAKAFELTELTRRTMRAGIRQQFPHASEAEIQEMYVDRLLHCHGTSLAEVRQLMRAERLRPPSP